MTPTIDAAPAPFSSGQIGSNPEPPPDTEPIEATTLALEHPDETGPTADLVTEPSASSQVDDTAESSPDPDQALTAVPAELAAGDPSGVPVLVGGADLVDSTATLLSYNSAQGTQEMLVAVVDETAEAKLVDALAVSDTLVPMAVETDVVGRTPLDTKHQLHEQVETIAKSINHHLKAGDGIPEHTHDNHAKLLAAIDAASIAAAPGSADEQMIAHYKSVAGVLGERLQAGYDVDYGAGGKVPHQGAYETTGKATITKYVPAPVDDAGLVTESRKASRPQPTISADGTASWDGQTRSKARGTEYAIDLGDGYHAVYRPYGANDPAHSDYSLRGSLEIVAPSGDGHGPELVDRLGQLNLVNRPMSHAEGEWTYLQRNVWAQGLSANPSVKDAFAQSAGLEDAMEQVLFAERAHKAVGMSEPQLHRFARQLRLDAEAKALPHKVRLLREGVAAATGHSSGADLAGTAGYDPTPRRRAGWLTWGRFDIDRDRAGVRKAFGQRGLVHRVSGNNLTEVLRTGVLASTERRQLMGIATNKGMSETADKSTGGASSVFLRVANSPTNGPALYWDDPTKILSRADWYAYNGDHFGSVNAASGHSISGQTRDPFKTAKHHASSNEVMVRTGLDLFGAEAPSRIVCANNAQRQEVLALLADKSITTLAGKPIDKVVTT